MVTGALSHTAEAVLVKLCSRPSYRFTKGVALVKLCSRPSYRFTKGAASAVCPCDQPLAAQGCCRRHEPGAARGGTIEGRPDGAILCSPSRLEHHGAHPDAFHAILLSPAPRIRPLLPPSAVAAGCSARAGGAGAPGVCAAAIFFACAADVDGDGRKIRAGEGCGEG